MNKVYHLLAFAASFALIIAILLTSVEVVAYYEPGFYETEYEKYHVDEDLHMQMKDVLEVTDEMMDYLRGDREDLVVYTTVDGKENVEFFGEQEKFHMWEVQKLFVGGLKLRTYLLLFAILIIGTIACMQQKPVRRMCIGYLEAFVIFLAAGAGIAVAVSRDFTAAFTVFHEIFFDNDLWLFDPNTSLMINMLPEGFFNDCVLHIGVMFGVTTVVFALVAILGVILTRERANPIRK